MHSTIVTGSFQRPEEGNRLRRQIPNSPARFTKLPAWKGFGQLEVNLPMVNGTVTRLWLAGTMPTLGGFVRHKNAAGVAHLVWQSDGAEPIRIPVLDEDHPEVEILEFSLDSMPAVGCMVLHFPSAAEIELHDVFIQYESNGTCPFHADSRGVSLDQLAAIVRVGDRVRFCKALDQLRDGILRVPDDLDEAKGLGLTFLSVVVSALLEHGAPREMHRFLLEAARKLDQLATREEVMEVVIQMAERCTANLMRSDTSATGLAIDRSLRLIEREYAKNLSDEQVASTVGLSTSHFRYLFRQITGQPFHKYLMALRLEKARQLLVDTDASITEIAVRCGFASPAHFSRAFSARFQATPSDLKRSRV